MEPTEPAKSPLTTQTPAESETLVTLRKSVESVDAKDAKAAKEALKRRREGRRGASDIKNFVVPPCPLHLCVGALEGSNSRQRDRTLPELACAAVRITAA